MGFDDVAAADVMGPVSTFDEDVREDGGDQILRLLFVEEDDVVDATEGGQKRSAIVFIDNGT